MRTIIDIPDELLKRIDTLRKSKGTSRAAAIRNAISEYLERYMASEKNSEKAFGIWKERKIDGLRYERTLRNEWK